MGGITNIPYRGVCCEVPMPDPPTPSPTPLLPVCYWHVGGVRKYKDCAKKGAKSRVGEGTISCRRNDSSPQGLNDSLLKVQKWRSDQTSFSLDWKRKRRGGVLGSSTTGFDHLKSSPGELGALKKKSRGLISAVLFKATKVDVQGDCMGMSLTPPPKNSVMPLVCTVVAGALVSLPLSRRVAVFTSTDAPWFHLDKVWGYTFLRVCLPARNVTFAFIGRLLMAPGVLPGFN